MSLLPSKSQPHIMYKPINTSRLSLRIIALGICETFTHYIAIAVKVTQNIFPVYTVKASQDDFQSEYKN